MKPPGSLQRSLSHLKAFVVAWEQYPASMQAIAHDLARPDMPAEVAAEVLTTIIRDPSTAPWMAESLRRYMPRQFPSHPSR